MRALAFLLSAPFIQVAALFFAILWMIRDQKDKVRPLLVMALTINLFYGHSAEYLHGRRRRTDAVEVRRHPVATGRGAWRTHPSAGQGAAGDVAGSSVD